MAKLKQKRYSSEQWKPLRLPRRGPVQTDIILVHDLYDRLDSRKQLEDDLKSALDTSRNVGILGNVRAMAQCDLLRIRLNSHLGDQYVYSQDSFSEDDPPLEVQAREMIKERRKRPLYFVACGYGGRLLHEALANRGSIDLLSRTRGIIFLGLPPLTKSEAIKLLLQDRRDPKEVSLPRRQTENLGERRHGHPYRHEDLQKAEVKFQSISQRFKTAELGHTSLTLGARRSSLLSNFEEGRTTQRNSPGRSTGSSNAMERVVDIILKWHEETPGKQLIPQEFSTHQSLEDAEKVSQHSLMRPNTNNQKLQAPLTQIPSEPSIIFRTNSKAQPLSPSLEMDPATKPKQAEPRSKKDWEDLFRLAQSCEKRCSLEAAKNIYLEYLAHLESEGDPDSAAPATELNIAMVVFQEGAYGEAEDKLNFLIRRLEHSSTANVTIRFDASRWLARSVDKQGRYKEAADILELLQKQEEEFELNSPGDAKKIYSKLALTKCYRALALAHLGSYERAETIMEEARSRQKDILDEFDLQIEAAANKDAREWAQQERKHSEGVFNLLDMSWAEILMGKGQYQDAKRLNENALGKMRAQFGLWHITTLDSSSLHARLLAIEGKLDDAESLCDTTWEATKDRLGGLHPSSLKTMAVLGLIYKWQGRYSEALQTYQYLFEQNNRLLGPTHPQTLRSRSELALVHALRGENSEALQHLDATIAAAVKHPGLGPAHPSTLMYQSERSFILCQLGLWYEATVHAVQVLHSYVDKFLPSLPEMGISDDLKCLNTIDQTGRLPRAVFALKEKIAMPQGVLQTLHHIAVACHERSYWIQACMVLEQVVQARVSFWKYLEYDHVDTLTSLFEFAITYRKLGQRHQLCDKFEKVFQGRQKLLGKTHPDTLSARHELCLARYWGGLSSAAETERELLEVRHLRTFLLFEYHPHCVESNLGLASFYHLQGDLDEAIRYLSISLEAQRRLYGGDAHPNIVRTRIQLAAIYASKPGDKAYADRKKSIDSEISDVQEFFQGLPHEARKDPAILSMQNDVGFVHQALGRLSEAHSNYDEVIENISHDHPLYSTALMNLAAMYFNDKNFGEAIKCQEKAYEAAERQEQAHEAAKCQEKAYEANQLSREPRHLRTLSCRYNLAVMRKSQVEDVSKSSGKKREKENDELLKTLETIKVVYLDCLKDLGDNHPLTACVLRTQEQWEAELKGAR